MEWCHSMTQPLLLSSIPSHLPSASPLPPFLLFSSFFHPLFLFSPPSLFPSSFPPLPLLLPTSPPLSLPSARGRGVINSRNAHYPGCFESLSHTFYCGRRESTVRRRFSHELFAIVEYEGVMGGGRRTRTRKEKKRQEEKNDADDDDDDRDEEGEVVEEEQREEEE